MAVGGDMPSVESLVGWLLEHQLGLSNLSDSDSLTASDQSTETDTSSDEYEEAEGAFGYVQVGGGRRAKGKMEGAKWRGAG